MSHSIRSGRGWWSAPWEWPRSSVRAHLSGPDDALVEVRPLLDRAPRFSDLLDAGPDEAAFTALRRSELIGRPLGSPAFVENVGQLLGRTVAPAKRGRKPKARGDVDNRT